MIDQINQICRRYYGLDAVPKDFQVQAILRILEGENVINICPTGAGKSFLYLALKALMPSQWLVVVTPTIALEKDAAEKAERLGIKALTNYASLLGDLTCIEPAIIFVAVEHLAYGSFQSLMKYLTGIGKLGCIVVDEIHVYQLWREFRHSMDNMELVGQWKVPLLLLSATMPRNYVQNIVLQWKLQLTSIRLMNVKQRTTYSSVRIGERQAKDFIRQQICRLVGQDRLVIFCYSIRDIERLSQYFEQVCCKYYHNLEGKDEQMDQFLNGNRMVMICSSSFGLGVDIANIRTVIHHGPSYTLIDYCQETGRGGRDGNGCQAILLDIGRHRHVKDDNMVQYCRAVDRCRRGMLHEQIDGTIGLNCLDMQLEWCDNCRRIGSQAGGVQINWQLLQIEQVGDLDESYQLAQQKLSIINQVAGRWGKFCQWSSGMCLLCYRGVDRGHQEDLCASQYQCPHLIGKCLFCLELDHQVDTCQHKLRALDEMQDNEKCGCLVPINVQGSQLHDNDGLYRACRENGRKHLRKYKVSTYANQGSKKVFYSQSKAVPAEKTPSPANKFNDAFVSPDHLLRLNRNANQPQPNKGDVVEQMADLDLEELRNHDVFDFMWEDTAPDTGEQIVKKQKRNKKEKKASLFKVSFRRRNVRPDMTATFRDCVQACNDELYFKQYDYDVAIECSACDKASSEVRCLTCDNCPQFCDACFVQMHRVKQFHLQQRLQSNQLAYKCGGSLSAFCVDPICKKSKHSVKLYQFPNGVADCEIDVCEHITSVKYGLFKALLALGYVACTASKPQYAIQLEVIKFYASLLRNSKCTASGFAASFSDVCFIGGSSYFRKHLLQSLRLYIALEKQFWKTHNLPFQFDCLACPNQVAAQYTSKIADIKDGELQADTGLTDEMLDMSIALSQAQLPQIPHLLQIALDGNFKLNHLNRGASSGDVNNTVVISDKLFFVDSLCFDLLKDEYKQQSSSCSSFKAVTQVAGQLRSKFNDITGLFGACCARHGPAISRTYSNFEKGEKYLHADVAVLNVLRMLASFQDCPDQLKVYYDVGCQWVVNLARRIDKTDLIDIDVLVPALHLYAHQSYCQAKFSSKFSLWSGKTAGELMESLWSVIGNFGYITKNLCIAAREEVIDHILWKHSMDLNDKIVLQIVQRYEIAEQELFVLEDYLYDHPVLNAQQMSVDEQCAAILLAPVESAPGDYQQKWTSEELYVKSLEDLQHMPNDRSLLKKVESFELKLGIDAASRWTVQKVEYKDARIALVRKRCNIILRQLKSEMVEITVLLDYKGKNTSSQFKKKVFARALKS
ncbi:hypothetical protein MIR68_006830 [Amoeboaphelidium protococcarum]|nr:hypothetical protein MIR68_006830 [Amoeboaphelidium protococcarum]